MNYPEYVKEVLFEKIREMDEFSWFFAKNPGIDFTRSRKIDFQNLIKILVTMEAGSLKKELLEFFQYDSNTPSASAFNQQRSKLLPDAMKFYFMHLPTSSKRT